MAIGRRQGGLLVARIHQMQGRVFARMLKAHKLARINPAQGRILFVLWKEDGLSMGELAKRTSLGPSTLTRMLDRMEKAGHVRRVYDDADRRKVAIALTNKNRALKSAYDEVSDAMSAVFYAGMSAAEIATLEGLLERVLANLTKHSAGS